MKAIEPLKPAADARKNWLTINKQTANADEMSKEIADLKAEVARLDRKPNYGGEGGGNLDARWS
jgi:cell division protein FtsB